MTSKGLETFWCPARKIDTVSSVIFSQNIFVHGLTDLDSLEETTGSAQGSSPTLLHAVLLRNLTAVVRKSRSFVSVLQYGTALLSVVADAHAHKKRSENSK